MERIQFRTEAALEHLLPDAHQAPVRLHQAMRYAVLGGGKRVRPLLVHAAAEAVGTGVQEAGLSRMDVLACALECIHAYSLVHDDLPCMDDDDLRRGKASVHVAYDEATALLVGDSLQSLAFQLLVDERVVLESGTRNAMVRILASAAGSLGMAGGQAIDLESVGKSLTLPELELMHVSKTGALIRASVSMGAQASGGLTLEELSRLDNFARCIGLAFQVVDDVLDAEGTTATLGKTGGKDAVNNKPTYVNIMGLSRAKEFAAELRFEAHRNLEGFGERAGRLGELADFIVSRKF